MFCEYNNGRLILEKEGSGGRHGGRDYGENYEKISRLCGKIVQYKLPGIYKDNPGGNS